MGTPGEALRAAGLVGQMQRGARGWQEKLGRCCAGASEPAPSPFAMRRDGPVESGGSAEAERLAPPT